MRDETRPEGRWEFDGAVTDAFDDMLKRSIPQYEVMREEVRALAKGFARPRTMVADLGCSRGEAMAPLAEDPDLSETYFVGLEASRPMFEAASRRFVGYPRVGILEHDLRDGFLADEPGYAGKGFSVVLSVLTLQFVPIEHRQRIVRQVYKALDPGGAMILVEKVLGSTAEIDDLLVRHYYRGKRENGYTSEQIERKRLSLEGVLVPVTARWNEELLGGAGFGQVDCFWRYLNFAGWLAVKGD